MSVRPLKRMVISGFATLDYVLTTQKPLCGTGTVQASMLIDEAWPRAGGATLYAARRVAAAGHVAIALVTLGDDVNGRAYVSACRAADVATDGIFISTDGKSPSCLLIYHDDGGYSCLLDYGRTTIETPTLSQAELIDQADWIVIAAAPAAWTRAVLGLVQDHQKLAWITKADPVCFPPEMAAQLSVRADIIFCNSSERGMIKKRSGQTVVETRGVDGVKVFHDGVETVVPVEPIVVRDATGAGDTLAGEVIARLMSDEGDVVAAVRAGVAAAGDLLKERGI